MKRIFFYATAADFRPVLRRAEEQSPLKFIPTGKRNEPNRPIHLHSSEIPEISILNSTTCRLPPTYIVSFRDTKNRLFKFRNNAGRFRWLLSNGDNPDTVLLRPGGLCENGTLLAGEVSTLHDTDLAQQLMHRLYSAIRAEHFEKVDTCWLGQEAFDMLKAGKRLTHAEQSPPELDLRLPEP